MSGDRGTMIGRLREKRNMEEQGNSINIEEKGQLLKQAMFDCAKNVCQFAKDGERGVMEGEDALDMNKSSAV